MYLKWHVRDQQNVMQNNLTSYAVRDKDTDSETLAAMSLTKFRRNRIKIM